MPFFDPQNPTSYVKRLIEEYKEFIDKINMGEEIDDFDKIMLCTAAGFHKEIRDLINEVGYKILTRELDELNLD